MPSQFIEEAHAAEQATEHRRTMDAQSKARRQCGSLQGFGQVQGVATTTCRDPQKMFTRAEVLTIIRAEQARLGGLFPDDHPVDTTLREGAKRLASSLISIFERME